MLCKQLKQVDEVQSDWEASIDGVMSGKSKLAIGRPWKTHSLELKCKCRVSKGGTKRGIESHHGE